LAQTVVQRGWLAAMLFSEPRSMWHREAPLTSSVYSPVSAHHGTQRPCVPSAVPAYCAPTVGGAASPIPQMPAGAMYKPTVQPILLKQAAPVLPAQVMTSSGLMVPPLVKTQAYVTTPRGDRHPLTPPVHLAPTLGSAVQRLLLHWQTVRKGSEIAISDHMAGNAWIAQGLQGMSQELTAWREGHPTPQESSLLAFHFPRAEIGKQLFDVISAGCKAVSSLAAKRHFVEAVSKVATSVTQLAVNPQEEELWRRFVSMEVEAPKGSGALGGQAQSFGSHLHMKGGVNGHVQVMQDWEWPYMYALADLGFDLAAASSLKPGPGALRILEVGWGQGISGRRLMDEPQRTGRVKEGITVDYEVVELHPVVAQDARAEAARRTGNGGTMCIHEGPWQTVLPTLPDASYDLIFFDPYNLKPSHFGEIQQFEQWGLPLALLENLLFYRLLRPGGVVVQYAISHGDQSASQILQDSVAPMFAELRISKIGGLLPEAGTIYASKQQADNLEVPALIK